MSIRFQADLAASSCSDTLLSEPFSFSKSGDEGVEALEGSENSFEGAMAGGSRGRPT